jgi:hypothetical protein
MSFAGVNSNNSDNVMNLYYSENNLDNTYRQVSDEILRRTSKDIRKNANYRASFNKMADIVYNKIPLQERNLMKCNSILLDKSVLFFHSKIFQKSVNNQSASNSQQQNDNNSDLSTKMNDMLINRQSLGTVTGSIGDGNVNSYMPQPIIQSSQVIQSLNLNKEGNSKEFQRMGDTFDPIQNQSSKSQTEFTINPFNLGEDMTEALIGSDIQDTPLYQNIEHLQRMDSLNPMSVLEDYTRKRNIQGQEYINTEKRQNITAIQTKQNKKSSPDELINNQSTGMLKNNAILNNTVIEGNELSNFGNYLTDRYIERMEERIVNSNDVNTNEPEEVENSQNGIVKLQRDIQPKYIEKVHYININSVDRNWQNNSTETRYDFQVKFNQNQDYQGGATISQMYRNVISVELVSSVMPMDAFIEPFDTRIYMGLSRYPYLLLRIEELDNVFRGTNNWVDKAFSTMIFDKVFYTNTLSSDYISGYSGFSSIVQSTPRQGFTGEYLRGFMKYNPAYFEKKKFYNNPLASLNRMTIDITDPRGNSVNTQKDVLDITNISYTGNIAAVSNTELLPSYAWPWSTQSAYSYIKITTTTYFSNRLFRIGDRIIIANFEYNNLHSKINDDNFKAFITRPEGHVILNLDVETNGATNTNNRGFINNIYIAPPGELDSLNKTVNAGSYYDQTTIDFSNVSNFGRLIDVDLQTQLLFRIVTREPDTNGTLQPINVY